MLKLSKDGFDCYLSNFLFSVQLCSDTNVELRLTFSSATGGMEIGDRSQRLATKMTIGLIRYVPMEKIQGGFIKSHESEEYLSTNMKI